MASLQDAFFGAGTGEAVWMRIVLSLLILAAGHLAVRLGTRVLRQLLLETARDSRSMEARSEAVRYVRYAGDALVIIAALAYLDAGVATAVSVDLAELAPRVVSVGLLLVLGIVTVNLSVGIATELFQRLGASARLRELGLSRDAIEVGGLILRIFLYMLVLQLSVQLLGIGDTFLNELVTASSWAFAFLVAALMFYGLKEVFADLGAGVILKNSRLMRPGERVTADGEKGKIREISLFSTTLESGDGYTVLKPNTEMLESDLRFKRTRNDIETLQEIRNYFASSSSDQGPGGPFGMALEILGSEAGKEAGEALDESQEPEDAAERVEELTDRSVRAEFVGNEKISGISDEMKSWFSEGALALPLFDKGKLFQEASRGYSVAVAVEDGEILMVDTDPDTSGVYFVEGAELKDSMSEGDGYVVLAPEGTNAGWRIEKGLIYSEKSYYDELSKTLEARLTKFMRQARVLNEAVPAHLDSYLDRWQSGDYFSKSRGTEEAESETASGDGN